MSKKKSYFSFYQAYFDRVNAPNTTDDTIRSSLCTMVTEVC
jgi:hypothetical protein